MAQNDLRQYGKRKKGQCIFWFYAKYGKLFSEYESGRFTKLGYFPDVYDSLAQNSRQSYTRNIFDLTRCHKVDFDGVTHIKSIKIFHATYLEFTYILPS